MQWASSAVTGSDLDGWFGQEGYGKYNREFYRKRALEVWRRLFIENRLQQDLPRRINAWQMDGVLPLKKDHGIASYHNC